MRQGILSDAAETWKVEYDADAHVVVSTIWGHPTTQDLMDSAVARIGLGQEKGTLHFILDTSGFLPSDISSFEAIYDTVTTSYPTMFVDPATKLAVIPPDAEDARWFMDFFQNMCDSRGWLAREVATREAALAWFEEPPEGSVPTDSSAAPDARSNGDGEIWTVHYLDDLDIVDLTYRDRIDGDIVLAASAARIEMGQRKNCSDFLIDCEQVTLAHGTAEAIFERVTKTYHYENADPNSRIGAVNPALEGARWFLQFFEQVGQSRGWNVRLFDSREAALAWLRESES